MVRNFAFLVLGLIAGFGLAWIVPGAAPAVEVRGVLQLPPAGPAAPPEASARGTDYAAIPFEGERSPAPVRERREPGPSQARPDRDGKVGEAWPDEEPSEEEGPAGASASTGTEDRTGVAHKTPLRRNDGRRRRWGPRPNGGARAEEAEESEPLPPFDFTESELRLVFETQSKLDARRQEKLRPYDERMETLAKEARAKARELRLEAEEELKLTLGPEIYARYQAEVETGRMREAIQAIENLDTGFLGVGFQFYGQESPGDPGVRGVEINSVEPGSAAYTAGVREGEVIVAVGGEKIEDPDGFRKAVRGTPPGQPLVLDLYDPASKSTRRVSVVLGDRGRTELGRLYRGD